MVNKVILVGNVGADPEVRTFESGTKTARINLATTERTYNRQTNETKDYTEWHTITFWSRLADIVDKYVRKGSQIYVEGSLRTSEWVDKDNIKRHTTVIIAGEMKMLGRRADNLAPQTSQTQPQSQTPANEVPQSVVPTAIADDADDLPF